MSHLLAPLSLKSRSGSNTTGDEQRSPGQQGTGAAGIELIGDTFPESRGQCPSP